MKIQAINSATFTAENKKGLLNKFHDNVRNSADLNDTITVPRTIFKGYLGIMSGTTIITLAGLINKIKHPTLFKSTMATGVLASMYGTWAFVRPYILKNDNKNVNSDKTEKIVK